LRLCVNPSQRGSARAKDFDPGGLGLVPHSLALIPHQIGAYTSGRPTTTGVPESWKCAGTAPLEDTIVNGCSAGYTTPDTCRCMSVAAREKHFLPQVSPIPLMREEAPQVYITTIHLFSPLFLPAAAAACLACQKKTQDTRPSNSAARAVSCGTKLTASAARALGLKPLR